MTNSTSDERREVAAKLMELAEGHAAVECGKVAHALGLEYEVHGSIAAFGRPDVNALADLINPTCHVVRKQVYVGGPQMYKTLWCCSECGSPLAESKYKGHRPFVDENFCHNCGARVVTGDGK